MAYKRRNKKHSTEQRLSRLERVSSTNYFGLKQAEKNQKEIVNRINELFPKTTFFQRLKWFLFGSSFPITKIEARETSIQEMAEELTQKKAR